jgi:hypothetical protein
MRFGEPSRTSRRAVVDDVDGEPGVAQTLADSVGQHDVILHDQHSHLHILPERV